MSKRGNPDYWKSAGQRAEDRDIDEAAKQRFGVSRVLRMRGEATLRRPHPPAESGEPRPIEPIPIRGDGERGLPWRVVRHTIPIRPSERLPGAEVAPPGLLGRAAVFVVHTALAPVRASLAIAEALVERVLSRLERHA